MDHELKQRLIGAVVVTALCAIFIPMLFDDPVDNSGQSVSELSIPTPIAPSADTAGKLPTGADQVLKLPDSESSSAETAGDTLESTVAAEESSQEPEKRGRSGESLYSESEGYTREDGGSAAEAVDQPVDEPEDSRPKSRSKQAIVEHSIDSAQGRPLSAEVIDDVHKSVIPKAHVRDNHAETAAKEPVKVKKVVETIKPAIVKKPEIEPSTADKDEGAKVNALQTPAKQTSAAKSLAVAVAEAKKPEVAPKANPKLVRWYIQVGSFSKKENAMSLWDSLREQGLPASLDTVQTDKGTSYRLRVGPELDEKKAAAMKLKLDKQNIKAMLISE
jgi:DedD protein